MLNIVYYQFNLFEVLLLLLKKKSYYTEIKN
jgi:hypothetical protein